MPSHPAAKLFYTVTEAAHVMRVDPATIYRAIRDDAFPAVKIRTRYIIPVAAVAKLAELATESNSCIDTGDAIAQLRLNNAAAAHPFGTGFGVPAGSSP